MDIRGELRVTLVPTVLAAIGFVAGSLVGGVVAVLWALAESPSGLGSDVEVRAGIFAVAMGGGILGVFVGTPVMWLLLRHVPIGKAVGASMLGTLVGAVAGLLISGVGLSLALSLAGFIGAMAWLRVRTPGRRYFGEAASTRLQGPNGGAKAIAIAPQSGVPESSLSFGGSLERSS